jgi:hypothetical protein
MMIEAMKSEGCRYFPQLPLIRIFDAFVYLRFQCWRNSDKYEIRWPESTEKRFYVVPEVWVLIGEDGKVLEEPRGWDLDCVVVVGEDGNVELPRKFWNEFMLKEELEPASNPELNPKTPSDSKSTPNPTHMASPKERDFEENDEELELRLWVENRLPHIEEAPPTSKLGSKSKSRFWKKDQGSEREPK